MKPQWPWVKWLAGGVVIMALTFMLWPSPPATEPGERTVEIFTARTYVLRDYVEALGTAQANESVEITSSVSEVIAEIRVEDGASIRKGDVIALLQQQEEQAELKAANAQLAEHARELKRLKSLIASRAAAKREYDERQTLYDVTQQQIAQIEARITDRTLSAPFDGVLGIRRLSPGSLMQPGDILTTLDDIATIRLDFTLPSLYLPELLTGMQVQVESEDLRRQFSGTIETVNSRVDPLTRSILVRAVMDNPDNIVRPGLLMNVIVQQNEREALLVPEESVLQKGSGHQIVMVDADNKAQIREVTIGVRRKGVVEIVDGLAAGEKVLVRGMGIVAPGQPVKIIGEMKEIPSLPEGIRPLTSPAEPDA